jgi:hypothetical protein
MKSFLTFLLALALVFSGLTRCVVGEDHEVVASDAGANLAVPGETLDNDSDIGNNKTSASFFQSCLFHHRCFAIFFLTQRLMMERYSSKDTLEVYKLNHAFLI